MKKEVKTEMKRENTLDIAAATSLFKSANDFIINIWKTTPIPTIDSEQDDDDDEDQLLEKRSKNMQTKFVKMFGTGTRAKTLEDLQTKLEALKGTKSYRDSLNKKGIKNRISKKVKKEQLALKKKLVKREKKAGIEFQPKVEEVKPKPVKPVYNSEGKMVFSKFDFTETNPPSETVEKKITDPRVLLQKLEKRKEKMKRLENTGDTEQVRLVKENFAWRDAIDKSDGVKHKNDPALLMKTIKKNKERKKQSIKKWEAQEENVRKKGEAQQKKRNDNIAQRQKQNKVNKLRKSAKKGRVIPGF